jgi:enoyl-CoA hydratase/carnithine racemase
MTGATTAGVQVERQGAVVVLTLANPAKRNALDPTLCRALADAVAGLAPAGARACVLTGAGDKAFCAGFDVSFLPGQVDLAALADNPFDALIAAVIANPVPIVCALNGSAYGGGCELAATCDLRVAHAGVELAMPPARLGIVYAARGLTRFAALCGESRARELFFTARRVGADEAARWGLVDHVVAAKEVLSRACALAESIAELAPLAVQGMRQTFETLLGRRAEIAAAEAALIDRLRLRAWASQDAAEARRAFAEKRKPSFTGA